jgi:GGDEF domain-containing protein
VYVSASIGGVSFAVAPESIDDMVGAADAQMYAAKSQRGGTAWRCTHSGNAAR